MLVSFIEIENQRSVKSWTDYEDSALMSTLTELYLWLAIGSSRSIDTR